MERFGTLFIQQMSAPTIIWCGTSILTIPTVLPKTLIDKLLEKYFFYIWDENENEIRLVTSWDTTEEDVRAFVEDVKRLSVE